MAQKRLCGIGRMSSRISFADRTSLGAATVFLKCEVVRGVQEKGRLMEGDYVWQWIWVNCASLLPSKLCSYDEDNLAGRGLLIFMGFTPQSGPGKLLLLLPELPKWSYTSFKFLKMLHELSTGKGTKVGAGRTELGHHMHKATLDSHWIYCDQKGGWPILCEL